MTTTAKSNDEYLRELTILVERFRRLVETENAAIERRDTAALRHLTPTKVETGNTLETLWREFQPRLEGSAPADRQGFAALAEQAAELRPLVARNLTLLNAAKIAAATRIEAGLAAWRRAQQETQPRYHDDGRLTASDHDTSLHPPRLV